MKKAPFLAFQNGVKNIQTTGYNGARTVWRPGIGVNVTQRHCVFKPITNYQVIPRSLYIFDNEKSYFDL